MDQQTYRHDTTRAPARRAAHPAWGAALALMLACPSSFATAYATRGPVPGAPAAGGYVGGTSSDSGLAESNPTGAPETFAPGYLVTTRASADNVTGAMKGSAGFTLDTTTTGPLPGAFFDDIVYGEAVVTGGAPGSTVKLTLTLDVHGAFSNIVGKHDLGLQSYLYVGPVGGNAAYMSQLEFNLPANAQTVQPYAVGRMGSLPNSPLYANATPVIESTSFDNLKGQATITFDAIVGQALFVQADFAGGAGPVMVGGQYLPSSATVDAWGTAQLHLLLPQGYALSESNGVLASTSVVTSVPEPGGSQLLLTGIAALLGLRTTRARRR